MMIVVCCPDGLENKKSHPKQYFFKSADLLKLVMIMEGYPRNGGIKWSTIEYPSRQFLCAVCVCV